MQSVFSIHSHIRANEGGEMNGEKMENERRKNEIEGEACAFCVNMQLITYKHNQYRGPLK